MNYYCENDNQEFIKDKDFGHTTPNINKKEDVQECVLDNCIPESKRKSFKIPDHISVIECNLLFYFMYIINYAIFAKLTFCHSCF